VNRRSAASGQEALRNLVVMTEAAFMPLMRTGLDPVPALGEVREREPVSKLEFPFGITAWLITGYDEARAVLGNAGGFSNDFANITAMTAGEAGEDQNPGGLGMADPPQHTRLRKMLTPEFTMRRLQRLVPRIEALVDELLDRMEAAGPPVDFVESFAMPLPSLVICELLDVPYPDREQFQRLSGARFDVFGGAGTGLDAISESLAFMSELVDAQRRDPGDGLLGMLIREHGADIDDRELAGLADGLLIGGHETTASMLALGAIALLSDAGYAELMRSGDADAVHAAVEELLRYLTVVQVAFPRFAREDIEIAGVTIPKGQMVLVSLSAANRDPRWGDGLQYFDPTRPVTSHFAFGYGIHRCVGAELARIELRIAYPALMKRFPGLRLDLPMDEIAFREYSVVYGVDRLPVSW
jgi:cytochrome P450